MHLVGPLISGVNGAANGTVIVRRRGTSTLATVYSDFYQTVLSQPVTGIPLDSNGGVSLYVNELADVVVRDVNGTTIRSFVAGDEAPAVEVISQSFTGVDYNTGLSAASKPTTLQVVLDAWKTSAGKLDFNVLFGGASTSIQNALGSIAGIFVNVKSPAYGAVGDGAADDSVAIQAAITAATSGAIVYFPPGSYRITVKLTVPETVSLWGAGPGASLIRMDHATNDTLEYGAGTTVGSQEIRGLYFTPMQANSGKPISLTAAGARRLAIVNCVIGIVAAGGYSGHIVTLASASHSVIVDGSDLYVMSASSCVNAVTLASVTGRNGARFICVSSGYTGQLMIGDTYQLTSCVFDMSLQTTGVGCTGVAFLAGSRKKATISGCRFIAGITSVGILCADSVNFAATSIGESGNSYDSFNTATTFKAGGPFLSGSNRPVIYLGLRESNIEVQANQAATYTVNNHVYGETTVASTSAGARTVDSAQGVGPEGAIWTFEAYNTSGGNIIYSFGSGFATGVPTMTVPTTKRGIYTFRAVVDTLGGAWVPLGAQIVTT